MAPAAAFGGSSFGPGQPATSPERGPVAQAVAAGGAAAAPAGATPFDPRSPGPVASQPLSHNVAQAAAVNTPGYEQTAGQGSSNAAIGHGSAPGAPPADLGSQPGASGAGTSGTGPTVGTTAPGTSTAPGAHGATPGTGTAPAAGSAPDVHSAPTTQSTSPGALHPAVPGAASPAAPDSHGLSSGLTTHDPAAPGATTVPDPTHHTTTDHTTPPGH
jgi:DNA polymerase-3 subunit gamma/tau